MQLPPKASARSGFPLLVVLLLLAAAVASCGRGRDESRTAGDGAMADRAAFGSAAGAATRSAPPPAPPLAEGMTAVTAGRVARVQPQAQGLPADAAVMPAMIIRTGNASVQVDSLEAAIAQLRQLAQRLGGYVANSSLSGGNEEMRAATLQLKIPSARFDDAVGGLTPLGRVESVEISAEDVGEEFVDVTARVANARRLEERLIDLLARRTGKLEEVLQVERELARVREEIERYEGRLRFLRTRAAVSTLSVTVHERAPVLRSPGRNPIGEAFLQSWRNFVSFTAGLIEALGVLVPLGVVAGALVWGLRRFWPRRSPPPLPPLPPPAAAE